MLVVDEGGSNTIDTFVVGPTGETGQAITTSSVGGGPFGFDFDRAGHLLVFCSGEHRRSADWLCLPRFASLAVFAALLSNDGAGPWTLGPVAASRCAIRQYA